MNIRVTVTALVLLLGAYQFWADREVKHPPGILVSEAPEQTGLADNPLPLPVKGATITPLASYKIRARVLAKERYWLGQSATFVPYDVALGWKEMSDSKVLEQLHFSQADRFYFYRWDRGNQLDPETMVKNSANMHLVAANSGVAARIKSLRRGQIVSLAGQLVRVVFKDGSEIKSSLSRDDTGPGACEVMWVTSINVTNL